MPPSSKKPAPSQPLSAETARARLTEINAELRRRLDARAQAARYDWTRSARPEQLQPAGEWRRWLLLAGRGFGKTRVLSETLRAWATSGRYKRIALVARTAADVRDVLVEGQSGILAVSPDGERPVWEPSRRRLTWPTTGTIATTYSAEEPDQLRGPQHDAALADEVAAWSRPDAWDQLMMGLRLGVDPRVVVATTPRPTPLIRSLLAAEGTVVTRGATRDNLANLAPGVVADLERRYAGTRLGRQELDGEILDDSAGALWRWQWIDAARVARAPDLRRVVVAIDPAASSHDESDETGIVVAGVGHDGRAYVLADASGRYRPEEWARTALALYREHKADAIVAEANNGGEMVAATLRVHDRGANVRTVHATRGKATRAEPVAALYEQGRASHVGALARLEDQLTTWDPATSRASPDRLDALVWALTEVMLTDAAPRFATEDHYDF
jgi:predicted phage terminase large subunit-like protein